MFLVKFFPPLLVSSLWKSGVRYVTDGMHSQALKPKAVACFAGSPAGTAPTANDRCVHICSPLRCRFRSSSSAPCRSCPAMNVRSGTCSATTTARSRPSRAQYALALIDRGGKEDAPVARGWAALRSRPRWLRPVELEACDSPPPPPGSADGLGPRAAPLLRLEPNDGKPASVVCHLSQRQRTASPRAKRVPCSQG